MKKLTIGLAAITLSIGLTACGNDDERLSEAEELERLEAPAAGTPGAMTPEERAVDPAYGTGMGGGMQQDPTTMPGAQNPPSEYRQEQTMPQEPIQE